MFASRASSSGGLILWTLLIVAQDLCCCAATTPESTSVDYEEVEVPSTHVPKFLSTPQSLEVLSGDTVTFPCEVDDLGTFSTVWKKGDSTVLFANSIRLMNDIHYQRLDNRSLQVRRVRPVDSASYHCIISSNPTVQINHTLLVLIPPKITSKIKNTIHLRKGQPLSLNCEASGVPPPTITWKFLDGSFPDGKSLHQGSVLYIPESTRFQAGSYECLATNGIGDDASVAVRVHINYPPEVEPMKMWVHSGPEASAELVCKVHAHPSSTVTWKGPQGIPISESDQFRLKWSGNEHTLLIRRMKKEDFGDYHCEASNKEGHNSAKITVSGLASPPEFKSSPIGDNLTSFDLMWTTHSHSTVIDYILKIKPQENGIWTTVRVPADSQQGLVKTQRYQVTGLEEATAYEAIVVVNNEFGNSEPSSEFVFYTLGAIAFSEEPTPAHVESPSPPSQSPALPHQQVPTPGKDGGGGATTRSPNKKLTSLLTVIILSVFFWY